MTLAIMLVGKFGSNFGGIFRYQHFGDLLLASSRVAPLA